MLPSFSSLIISLTLLLRYTAALPPVPLSISAAKIPSSECTPTQACALGCCSPFGFCGYGPNFCGPTSNCIPELSQHGTCNLTSECDPGTFPKWIYEPWGPKYAAKETCPLNVCCSQFGFCGTTVDFCGNTTVPQPQTNRTESSLSRTIGYYEGWSPDRPCDQMSPDAIPLDAYTHLVFSFLEVDPITYKIRAEAPREIPLFAQFTALKHKKPGMEVWFSIGGWAFTDWPRDTAFTFSDLVGSKTHQVVFFESLLAFIREYGFDGVDMDWEYPVTPDRNGTFADYTNYISFMQDLREVLNAPEKTYGLSMTIPSSYWYMQEFDIIEYAKIIDWFNVMTYDLHGTWDATSPYIGNVMLAHTNLTEIHMTMDLLWRNDIDPDKVTMGYGFYGRSFTASDPSCIKTGCPFSSGSNAGPCTTTPGILSYTEILRIIADPARNATVTLDPIAAVKIVTWDKDQWISFDDEVTIRMKQDFANARGIGGQMVWAVSLDTPCGDAASFLANHSNQCILDASKSSSSSALRSSSTTIASSNYAQKSTVAGVLLAASSAKISASTLAAFGGGPKSDSGSGQTHTIPLPPNASGTGSPPDPNQPDPTNKVPIQTPPTLSGHDKDIIDTIVHASPTSALTNQDPNGNEDPCAHILAFLHCCDVSFAIYSWKGDCGSEIGRKEVCNGECAKCLPVVINGDGNENGGEGCLLVHRE